MGPLYAEAVAWFATLPLHLERHGALVAEMRHRLGEVEKRLQADSSDPERSVLVAKLLEAGPSPQNSLGRRTAMDAGRLEQRRWCRATGRFRSW